MEQNWTKEPWPDPTYNNDVGPQDEGFWEWWEIGVIAKFDCEEDARRAQRAVNALAGIADPAAAIKAARELARLSSELCEAIDRADDDIGGSRPLKSILRELGPATDSALALLNGGAA